MNKQKRILGIVLVAAMLLSLLATGLSAVFADEPDSAEIDAQLNLILSRMDSLLQADGQHTWYYTVTDLDHNGRLEFLAASQHALDRSTNLRLWEVSADRSGLNECGVSKEEEESFPDILTDNADTFHDTQSGAWSYLFYDNVVLSASEVYTSKSAYTLRDGVISYEAYAVEHTVIQNGARTVTHTDNNGIAISPEQYNAAGVNAFAGTERSSTAFDWFRADEARSLSRLADSFSVFMGRKAPTQVFPVPKPQALQEGAATPAPEATPTPVSASAPTYLNISKNPTSENKTEEQTALFVAGANSYESLSWTMVSPNGGEYSVGNFKSMFPRATVTGDYSTTLSIANVSTDMNNWGAYCTFYYRGQTARTSTAYLYVSAKPTPKAAPSGTYSGTVTDWSYSTVTVNVAGQVTVAVPMSLCDIEGDLYYGASAAVVWDGKNITYCRITGQQQYVGPVYGSTSGTIYRDTAYTVYIVTQDGTALNVNGGLVNIIGGDEYDGASCTVYYTNYLSSSNVYQVDAYGYNSYTPTYNSMSGTAYSGGGGYAINLDSGEQVYVDGWRCNVSGTFVEGSRCTVYFTGNYASSDSIYQVDIYGSYDQGGWAGSNYYDYNYYEPEFHYDGEYAGETGNYYYGYATHDSFNYDGSTYEAIWCPYCGAEVSLAMEYCPVCGRDVW